jgi:hypothetical protein
MLGPRGFHGLQGTDPAVMQNGRRPGSRCGGFEYTAHMKKPILGLIILAVAIALGFKVYKAMTVEVPVEDQA